MDDSQNTGAPGNSVSGIQTPADSAAYAHGEGPASGASTQASSSEPTKVEPDAKAAPGTAAPLEVKSSGVAENRAAAIANAPASNSPEDVKKYQDEVHDRAEAERALGTGAETRRVNPGATE